MDPDSLRQSQSEQQQQNSNNMSNVFDVFPTTRIRCSIFTYNEFDRFLLDYGCNFLPYISLFSWFIFLLLQN